MEELRSIEAIDNEIKNDSRKKAARIIQKAEETAAEILSGTEERIRLATQDAKKASEERLSLYQRNINASLPLEKQRYLVSYINESVVGAINEYFKSLPEQDILKVLSGLLERSAGIIENRKVNALVYNMAEKDAKKILSEKFGDNVLSVKAAPESDLYDEAVPGFEFNKGMILKTEDGKIKCSLTLGQRVKEILDEKNSELAVTLFGGRLPE